MGDQEMAPGAAGQGSEAPAKSGEPSFDFERGYNELRPEYTRATQRLSEYEQLFAGLHDSDPEVQAAAMEALGLEMDTGSQGATAGRDPDDFVDPLEEELTKLRSEVTEIRSARELESQRAEEERLLDLRDEYIGEAISHIEGELKPTYGDNFKFTEREEEVLGNLAIAMAGDDGVPDVQSAYSVLYGNEGVLETNRQRWIDSKLDAPRPPAGKSVPAEKKPQNKNDRIAYIDEMMARLDRQQ